VSISDYVRQLWLYCCVACCIGAVASTLFEAAPEATAFIVSGVCFFLMSSVSHEDLDQ